MTTDQSSTDSDWEGISLDELEELIADGLVGVDDVVRDTWEAMRITPQKWQCSPWGDEGGGFWVVAERNGDVIWYNDIEEGFNTSSFTARGIIGEYYCNQDTFHEFLLSLPEARGTDQWPMALASDDVPPQLRGGGEIVRRQTTYWEVRTGAGVVWRCHFKEKAETLFREEHFSSMAIVANHPVLAEYCEPHATIFLASAPRHEEKLLRHMAEQVAAATGNWRQLGEYLNPQITLSLGYGVLVSGPRSIVDAVTPVLDRHGVEFSVAETWVPNGGLSALLMGRNMVVARAFRFEMLRVEQGSA